MWSSFVVFSAAALAKTIHDLGPEDPSPMLEKHSDGTIEEFEKLNGISTSSRIIDGAEEGV